MAARDQNRGYYRRRREADLDFGEGYYRPPEPEHRQSRRDYFPEDDVENEYSGPVPGYAYANRGYFGWAYPPGGYGYGNWPLYTSYADSRAANLSDEDIQDMVYDALDDNPFIPDYAEIDVNVKNHVATLTGTVRSRHVKRAAGDVAWSVPGILDVHNNITLVSRREAVRQTQQGQGQS